MSFKVLMSICRPTHCTTMSAMSDSAKVSVQGKGTISDTVLQEIMAHRNLYHPNILLFKKVILNSQALGIVVEYQAGGSLDAYIQQNCPLQASLSLPSAAAKMCQSPHLLSCRICA